MSDVYPKMGDHNSEKIKYWELEKYFRRIQTTFPDSP